MPIFPPNRPASGPQYLDENEVDALEHHQRLAFSRYLSTLRNKVDDLKTKILRPAMLDQFPGKRVPYAYSRLYGPIPQTAAGPLEDGGTPASATNYLTPRNGNVLVGQDGPFYWTATAVTGYIAMADLDGVTPDPIGDIFDMRFPDGGGATVMNSFGGHFPLDNGASYNQLPTSVAFDIELYDKGRGRRLHDDRLPVELFSGASFANKNMSQPTKFAPNTNLEPRIYINQFRINDSRDGFIANRAVAYVNLTFLGYKDLDV